MKRFFLSLAVAAMCSLNLAHAIPCATTVEAKFNMAKQEVKFQKIEPLSGGYEFNVRDKKKVTKLSWYYLPIRYELTGFVKPSKNNPVPYPLYVDELKVHVYLLFYMGRDDKGGDKYVKLDKEITYVEIPLTEYEQGNNKGMNKEVYAAVFLSPMDVIKLSEMMESGNNHSKKYDDAVNVMKNQLVAVAVEFMFKGAECSNSESKKKLKKGLVAETGNAGRVYDGWWNRGESSEVKLRAINETPFAPFYSAAFPATASLYGAGTPAAADFTPVGGYVPEGATGFESDDDADAPSTDKKKDKKRDKKKGRR